MHGLPSAFHQIVTLQLFLLCNVHVHVQTENNDFTHFLYKNNLRVFKERCEYKLFKDFLVFHTGYEGINAIIAEKNA